MPSEARSSQVTHTGSYLSAAVLRRCCPLDLTGRMNMTLHPRGARISVQR